jgi:hypothetical protein
MENVILLITVIMAACIFSTKRLTFLNLSGQKNIKLKPKRQDLFLKTQGNLAVFTERMLTENPTPKNLSPSFNIY